MSGKSLLAITVCTAGACLLGYCIYFDKQRRSDPEYKKKVHMRRQRQQSAPKYHVSVADDLGLSDHILDTDDDSSAMRCFFNEIKMGDHLISQGNVSEGIGHLANAIMMCAQPTPMLQTLQESLPERIFMPLIMKLREMHMNVSSSSSSTKISTSSMDFS